ncbi:hypothetical protein AVEN_194372-1 [Araneus ventricosus]|uniref:Uncharacterized protein n=1 Tax=Araneus ventricosus TaxID=182803 RepID=A0A4Y2A5V8_ARAVE|nr:hypothetical protein AVEN_194372-1 [Araneus ventricosus]
MDSTIPPRVGREWRPIRWVVHLGPRCISRRYSSHLVGLLKGMKRKGHSLGLGVKGGQRSWSNISSLSGTENGKNLPQTISQICEVPTASQDLSGFKLVKEKKKPKKSSQAQSANNNKVKHNIASKIWKTSPSKALFNSIKAHHKDNTNNATFAKITNTPSDSSQGYSSDTDSDMGVNSALRSQNIRGTGQDRNLKSPGSLNRLNVDCLKRISLPNLKKSSRHNSVALGLSDRGIVHKDLPSIFGGLL